MLRGCRAPGAPVIRSVIIPNTMASLPRFIALDGSDLFVTSGSTIGEYTTSGATVDAPLVSGLSLAAGIAIVPTPEPATVFLLGEERPAQ